MDPFTFGFRRFILAPLYASLKPIDGSLTLESLNLRMITPHLGGPGPDMDPFTLGFMLVPLHALLTPSDGSFTLESLNLMMIPLTLEDLGQILVL